MSDIGAGGVWLIASLALAIAELAAPGIFLIFLAVAAAITGMTALALPGVPPVAQLVSFAIWSALAVMIGRRWYRDYPVRTADAMLNDRGARLVGQIVTVEAAIVDGSGRVRVGDGGWPALGPDAEVGERLTVTACEGGVLTVQRLNAALPRPGTPDVS